MLHNDMAEGQQRDYLVYMALLTTIDMWLMNCSQKEVLALQSFEQTQGQFKIAKEYYSKLESVFDDPLQELSMINELERLIEQYKITNGVNNIIDQLMKTYMPNDNLHIEKSSYPNMISFQNNTPEGEFDD